MKEILSDPSIADNYNLYVTSYRIPIISDLVLVDPESSKRSAIVTYTKTIKRAKNEYTHPVKMEVIKDKAELLESFKNTCLEYLSVENGDLLRKIKSVADIDKYLIEVK